MLTMNDIIEMVLSGEISMDDFLPQLQKDPKLQDVIRSFVPNEAIQDPAHAFWKVVPYASLQQNNFDYYQFLFWGIHSKGKYGKNLNIFSRIKKAYLFFYPDVSCTSIYEDAFDIYLDAIRDCYDGPEVLETVDNIIAESLQIKPKSKQIRHARTRIQVCFHVENNKRPRWIQGPEWPMGSHSPMVFAGQKKKGEIVQYTFTDADTGVTKFVVQFY